MKQKVVGAVMVAILMLGASSMQAFAQRGVAQGGNINTQPRQWAKPESPREIPSQDSRNHPRSVRFTQQTFGGYNNNNNNNNAITPAKAAGAQAYPYGNYMQDGKRRYR